MEVERIVIEVNPEEFKRISELKDGRTWRELFLPALGIETKRQTPGPDRKGIGGSQNV
jgi:hypothetical protein